MNSNIRNQTSQEGPEHNFHSLRMFDCLSFCLYEDQVGGHSDPAKQMFQKRIEVHLTEVLMEWCCSQLVMSSVGAQLNRLPLMVDSFDLRSQVRLY